ncbi:MAG: zf-TFIIB domain-containing protein [Acidobacteriota bacterium]
MHHHDDEADRSCPRCGPTLPAMEKARDQRLMVDHCRTCHGIWLDRGEWVPVVGWVRSVERPHSIPEGSVPPSCPACLVERDEKRDLVARGIRHVDDVEIDLCQQCGGAWLDGGELRLLKASMSSALKAEGASTPAASLSEQEAGRSFLERLKETWTTLWG